VPIVATFQRFRLLLQPLLAGLLAAGLYLNGLHGAFIFDDWAYIAENPLITDFRYFLHLGDLQDYVAGRGVSLPYDDLLYSFVRRPATYLTFALNHALHGTDPLGYKLFNLTIHAATTMGVYLFVHLLMTRLHERTGETGPPPIPFLVALLFACHPVQTQAVSYTIQRFASLAACCYILSLASYLLSRRSPSAAGSRLWYGLALVLAATGMLSKENVLSLPVMVLGVEVLCFRETLRKRATLLAPFLATVAIIPLTMTMASGGAPLRSNLDMVNFNNTPQLTYLFTEFRVLVTYLRLLLLPVNQQLDYDYPVYDSFLTPSVMASALALLLLAAAGAYALYRGERCGSSLLMLSGFGIPWFFVTLSVESGLVPMDDVIFENRLYLPSIGIFMTVTAIGSRFPRLIPSTCRQVAGLALVLSVIAVFSGATLRRNSLWADTVRFMEDNAAKSPGKERVQILLGDTYLRQGRPRDALAVYEKIPLTPDTPQHLLTNLANAYVRTGDMTKGIELYYRAMARDPKDYIPYSMLGTIFMTRGEHATARELLDSAIRLNRFDLLSRKARAELFRRQADLAAAIAEYDQILVLSPHDAEAVQMLARMRHLEQGAPRK